VTALRPQIRDGDRLIVIADNCTDGTAAAAEAAGATVIERRDAERHGKGFAMEHGVRRLEADPPEVVIFIDADCEVSERIVDVLAGMACAHGRPCQGLDLLSPPAEPGLRDLISAFAFEVKNLVRPLGLSRLGLPCMLMGTGMAFPWGALRESLPAGESIVEDVEMGLNLVLKGHPPLFVPQEGVRGMLASGAGALSQRRRWEHGLLHVALTRAPKLLAQGLFRARPVLFAMGLDLLVPPLSLVFLAWALTAAAALGVALAGGGLAGA
jgi:cellulose synthase/poly-beta-1,6-N-acetylglucosamine synthase-like glycosyltransferase